MQHKVTCNATKPFVTFDVTLDEKDKQLKELGNWIKNHREKALLSQETAAEKAGLSRYQWMRIENGQSGTKRDTLIQIASVINADVNQTLKKGGFTSFLNEEEYQSRVDELGQLLALYLFASGFDNLEDEELQYDFIEDLYVIAESLLKRKLEEQDKRKRASGKQDLSAKKLDDVIEHESEMLFMKIPISEKEKSNPSRVRGFNFGNQNKEENRKAK